MARPLLLVVLAIIVAESSSPFDSIPGGIRRHPRPGRHLDGRTRSPPHRIGSLSCGRVRVRRLS